jgi:hypothetical protein
VPPNIVAVIIAAMLIANMISRGTWTRNRPIAASPTKLATMTSNGTDNPRPARLIAKRGRKSAAMSGSVRKKRVAASLRIAGGMTT